MIPSIPTPQVVVLLTTLNSAEFVVIDGVPMPVITTLPVFWRVTTSVLLDPRVTVAKLKGLGDSVAV